LSGEAEIGEVVVEEDPEEADSIRPRTATDNLRVDGDTARGTLLYEPKQARLIGRCM
jgi:hypothetical protein